MKYHNKYVLNDKPFEMPVWSVEKHEKLLELMIPFDKEKDDNKLSQENYNKKYRLMMIMLSLKEVDPNLKESDLKKMHPDDFIDLWVAVYNSGREGIRVKDSDFQEGEENPQ